MIVKLAFSVTGLRERADITFGMGGQSGFWEKGALSATVNLHDMDGQSRFDYPCKAGV